MKDQQLAERAAQHDQAATEFQKQGNPQQAKLAQARADEVRRTDKSQDYGVIEFIVSALFGWWLDAPQPAQKR